VRTVVAKLLRRRDDSPELLGWWDASERCWVDVKSATINDHVKALSGQPLTAKDFRTWHASVLMAMNLAVHASRGETLTKKRLSQAFREVSDELGNTPAVVRNSYVDPRVIDLAERGKTIPLARQAKHELVPTSASNALRDLLDHGREE
jgi:DNA topoisomerase IB